MGWIGVRSNLYHLDALHDAFTILRERYRTGSSLKIVSSDPVKTALSTRFTPGRSSTESDSVLSFDIGIMPLQDDPFSRGKCAFKAVFCMSRGVPVGCVAGRCQHGADRARREWLARSSTDDWVEGISMLTEESDPRARMGRLARETIEERYSAAERASEDLAHVLRAADGGAISYQARA